MGLDDNDDKMVRLLEQIAKNTAQPSEPLQDVTLEGSSIQQRTGVIPHESVVINETGDLDAANADGSLTLSPGDVKTLARFDTGSHAVYAVGATDNADVKYWLEIDNDRAVGPTRSPLGTVNSPFSFVDAYGGAIPADRRSALKVGYDSGANGDINLVGRIHCEVIG